MKKLILLLITVTGCSVLRAAPAPTSPFLTETKELKPDYDRAPWDSIWQADSNNVMSKSDKQRSMFIAPVNTQYLNMKKDDKGQYVQSKKLSDDDIKAMTEYTKNSFIDAIKNTPDTNLQLVDDSNKADLVLEVALIELMPTVIVENVAADVGGVLLPGSKAIEQAAATGGQAVGGALASGSIAMEFKILDGKTGAVLAEAKDRQGDAASIIPNYRDFEKYGWSRKTVRDWSGQFAKIFSTPASVKVEPASDISIKPW